MIIGANQGANSQVYWDDRFDTNWEENRGRAYSRNYAELAFSHVPQWLIGEINRNALSICDWGCAMGDGTACLANLLPTAKITGIDFSGPGIEKAREYYPHISFECEDWLADGFQPSTAYDVVFSSHTLEHFGNPWAVIEAFAPLIGRALVFIVPFQERDLIAEHCYSFQFGNILLNPCEDLDLAFCKIIDDGVERSNCWNGRQVLLVYIRRKDPLWNGLTLADIQLTTSASDAIADTLSINLREKDAGLKELAAQSGKLEARHRQNLRKQQAEFRTQLRNRESQLKEQQNKLFEKESLRKRKLEAALKDEKRKHAGTRNKLRRAESYTKTLETSLRFRTGNAIVGAVIRVKKILKAPFVLVGYSRGEGSVSSDMSSNRAQHEHTDVAVTTGDLTDGGRPENKDAHSDNGSRADRTAPKPFVYDLSKVDAQAVRERDVGYLFPPVASPERTTPETKVASVLDEFSDQCFRYEADLVRVTPDNWLDQLEEKQPQFLLVESAWHGNGDSWCKMIESCDDVEDNELVHLIEYCKSQQIPTVFWNKEDPPNFNHFIDAAGHFDFVFTSDQESIPRYRELLGHDRIEALTFAAQPQIHNPIGKRDSSLLEVGFAGTWYGTKHEDRRELLRLLLDAASDRNLHVFDRMSEFTANENYLYPERFSPYLHTALAYDQMVRAYRDFRLFLNVNSVLASSTMFARRVLEVLACQTNVVSTTSLAVTRMLGDVVSVVDNQRDAHEMIAYLLDNELERLHKAHLGWRKVMREHTYARRLRTIEDVIGVAAASDDSHPLVSVLVRDHERGKLAPLLDALHRQTYPNLEILVGERSDGSIDQQLTSLAANRPNVRSIRCKGVGNLERVLACAASDAHGDLLTLFDSRDRYGPDFIWDLVTALSYSGTNSVGKACYFSARSSDGQAELIAAQKRFRHVDRIPTRAFIANRTLLASEGGWRLDEDENICCPTGQNNPEKWSYSTDAFNYVQNVHSGDDLATGGPTDDSIPLNAVDV